MVPSERRESVEISISYTTYYIYNIIVKKIKQICTLSQGGAIYWLNHCFIETWVLSFQFSSVILAMVSHINIKDSRWLGIDNDEI